MRLNPLLGLLTVLCACAYGQAPATDLFKTVRPQVMISIRKDPNGSRADLIEALSIDANYPAEQLRAQIVELGRLMGSEPRGLALVRHSVSGEDSRLTSVMATCAIDNIIDRKTGALHLTEIARAFAGYKAPFQVDGLTITFANQLPTKNTILAYGTEKDPVQLQGKFDPAFQGIEYRLKYNTQNPAEILIPELVEQKGVKGPSSDGRNSVDWSMWGLIAVAAVAVGALVYSLLIRTTSSKRS